MIAYLAAPVVVPPVVPQVTAVSTPTLSEWALILLAFGLMWVATRRLATRQGLDSDISKPR
jgi:hypothetical protein